MGTRKVQKHYEKKWKARKIAWTLPFRRAHNKEPVVQRGQTVRRKVNKAAVRVYSGLTEEQIARINASRQAQKK
eukprot:gnl/Chilomastix_caulleri/665.p1 GENE.gnl/Chilomastix_caulleri/665~~gnl/Chilomastix_caulleri/665.p1  ORF type:complete len:74 (-),score=16.10 gnl/Chilomastix_caulleri/665:69-290(-)